MTRPIDADALIEELEKVYESLMSEVKDANDNPDNYTSKFIPAMAGRMDGIVDAEIVINDAPTIEPDGGLISRRAAIEAIEKLMKIHFDRVVVLNKAKDAVNALPSAPDSRQRGEWVRKYDGHINCYWYECDQCGEYRPRNQFGHEYNANFCPNCGAIMYKGGDNHDD